MLLTCVYATIWLSYYITDFILFEYDVDKTDVEHLEHFSCSILK